MTRSPFIVYVLPVILSVSLGTLVMAEALNDSERELNMWQFDGDTGSLDDTCAGGALPDVLCDTALSIIGLEETYSTSDQIEFKIQVSDSNFDCGDLYITIQTRDLKETITQSGFSQQCFAQQNQNIPLDYKYSEIIREPGKYVIFIEIFNQNNNDSLSYAAIITVK